jgi:hypothetical protein
LYDIVVDHEA